ncbi:LPS assembly lipoprotein LptE [Xanthobacter autotrophicus]|uniref:LPS assembly lipoprotein LptE n=1 Tax=Xanthobacter TaxID=279 RepID=UPI0024AB3264|nr:LPS assembly lipoprotein LptE [Xanthobacter autotrophicus]MDI4665002.1 LPS assembly lipoprotein LptE [Xanthobacter autotrophicus]
MSLPDPSSLAFRPAAPLLARLALVCALAGALAGCFQPLYAENATVGGPALMDKFRDVEVVEIRGRLGNDLRNDLIFALSGGEGNPKGAPLQLIIAVDTSSSTAIVNSSSGLPENQIVRVTANWRLVKADDPKKKVVTSGAASGTATIDTSDQRFANYSAGIDAEKRAARSVADQIKAQLGAFFIRSPGTPGSAS